MISLNDHIIPLQLSIKDALLLLDKQGMIANVLFVVDDENKLHGTITDGDIRRGFIKGIKLEDGVEHVMQRSFQSIRYQDVDFKMLARYKEENIFFLPVLDDNGILLDILNLYTFKPKLPVDAVIMAGGKGQRLLPLTKNIPKPLLKVGEKPIIEHNVDRIIGHGIENIFLSINYLGDQLINYFGDGSAKNARIRYVTEDKPLGTIGAVKSIDQFENDTVLVMNSDLLTNIDFAEFYEQFLLQDADMAIAAIPYHVDIPYAILETIEGNRVYALKEKPRYSYFSNAGIYLLKRDLIRYIPDNEFYNITDLIEHLINIEKKVISFSLLGYWLDIGKHEDFRKAQEDIKHLKL